MINTNKRYLRRLPLLLAPLILGVYALSAQESDTPDDPDTPQTENPPENPQAQTDLGPRMTVDTLDKIIKRLDENALRNQNAWQFTVAERQVVLVSDPNADRMRIMSPIIETDALPEELYKRMMQANFDAVLDARYAVGQDLLWSVFIHPLGSLEEPELLSGISQVVTAAITFGTTYSSGATVYGGGDSNGILRDQILNELRRRAGSPV